MELSRIVKREGYRAEDLSPKNQEIIEILRDLAEDVQKYPFECIEVENPDSAFEKVLAEISASALEEFNQVVTSFIDEIQISLAEQEEDQKHEQQAKR